MEATTTQSEQITMMEDGDKMATKELEAAATTTGTDNAEVDDTPEFIDMNDAVEVKVDDDDVPMEEDDDEVEAGMEAGANENNEAVPVPDMSKAKVVCHTDAVYTVACHLELAAGGEVPTLLCISGGGDDKAFLHRFGPGNSSSSPSSSTTHPLTYAHTDSVSCAALNLKYVSADLKKTPRLAAVGSFDGAIILYDPDTGEKKLKLEGPSDVEWLCFHPKGGSVLLAGSGDGTVWMFHIPLNKCLQVFVGHEQGVTAGSFTPDGKWALTASSDGTLRMWAPKTGMSKHVFRFGGTEHADTGDALAGLTCLATHGGSDGQLVLVGAEDGVAYVCHVGATKKVVATLRHFEPPSTSAKGMNDEEEMEYPMSVEAVGFSPLNPNWCATGGVDGALKIWDLTVDGGQCRHTCRISSSDENDIEGLTQLMWHKSLPVIFTGTSHGNVHLWDARTGGLLQTLTGHTEMLNSMDIQFMENGNAVIAAGGDDKTVRIFDVNVPEILQQNNNNTLQ